MNTINFTANLIKRTQIQRRNSDNKFEPYDVSIVELDKNYEPDINSLYKASILWNDQGARYSSNIYHDATKGYEYDDVKREHYFALTEQNKDFDNLDEEKILGLMLFSESVYPDDEITWLQVRPNTNTPNSWKRKYKGVGTAMINMLKDTNLKKDIRVKSADDAVEFYKKQGFKQMATNLAYELCLEA